jgi:hypothetical protein
MKKVMFTFVATLAFGLFANANTIDVETVETVEIINIKNYFNVKVLNTNYYSGGINWFGIDWDCMAAAIQVYTAYVNAGMDHSTAQNIGSGVYRGCIGTLPGRQ